MDERINGVPVATGGTMIIHLFFLRMTTFFFVGVNFNEWCTVMELIKRYEVASGQRINSSKTAIYFSRNTGMPFREFICSSVGISSSASFEIHLGLPSLVGRSNIKAFSSILVGSRKGWMVGSSVRGNYSSYPHLLHERVSYSFNFVPAAECPDEQFRWGHMH
jgi:hypothetical protein